MEVFAPTFVRSRMEGFQKDIRICLRPIKHPWEPRATYAYFPALGLCCATLDLLSSRHSGRIENGPHLSSLNAYSASYLPQPAFNEDILYVLFRSLRHSIAHQGIAARVWIDRRKNGGKAPRRISWLVSPDDHAPAIRIVAKKEYASPAPWPTPITHRTYVYLGRLSEDIVASALSYANDLEATPALRTRFERCMRVLFPTA